VRSPLLHPTVFAITAMLAMAAPAFAGDPAFKFAADKDREELAKVKDVEWKASAQGGLLTTSGNSRISALSAGLVASRKAGSNKLQLDAGLAYARSSVFIASDVNGNGVIDPNEIQHPTSTTNQGWTTKVRYDRFLTEHNSIYAAGLAAVDKPAGKEFVGGGQLGYSRQLYKSGVHELVAEGGYDFSYENPVVGDGAGIHSIRLFAGYAGKLSDDTGLDGSIETLLNVNGYKSSVQVDAFEDTRVTSKVSLTTKMFEDVSFRFGFESKYDNAPSPRAPFPGLSYADGFVPLADELDTKVEASLIVNFL
jgi:putative salt-induced outer membrane protein YdiY